MSKELAHEISSLKAHGYKIIIRHCRHIPFENDCMTRGEYERYLELDSRMDIPHNNFGKVISNTLGFTEVKIVSPTKNEYYAKHNFGRNEQFNRRTGRLAALHKALGQLHFKENM